MRFNHQKLAAQIEETTELLRVLKKYEMKCFYIPTPQTIFVLEDVIKGLKRAVESQQVSEHFDREAEYDPWPLV